MSSTVAKIFSPLSWHTLAIYLEKNSLRIEITATLFQCSDLSPEATCLSYHKTENRERIVILRDIIKESMIQSEIRHLCAAHTNVTQNEINPYEQPSIDVLDVRIESTLLTGSNLENISDGGEWEWDN